MDTFIPRYQIPKTNLKAPPLLQFQPGDKRRKSNKKKKSKKIKSKKIKSKKIKSKKIKSKKISKYLNFKNKSATRTFAGGTVTTDRISPSEALPIKQPGGAKKAKAKKPKKLDPSKYGTVSIAKKPEPTGSSANLKQTVKRLTAELVEEKKHAEALREENMELGRELRALPHEDHPAVATASAVLAADLSLDERVVDPSQDESWEDSSWVVDPSPDKVTEEGKSVDDGAKSNTESVESMRARPFNFESVKFYNTISEENFGEDEKLFLQLLQDDPILSWGYEYGGIPEYIVLRANTRVHYHILKPSGDDERDEELYIQLTARCIDEDMGGKCHKDFVEEIGGHNVHLSGCHFREEASDARSNHFINQKIQKGESPFRFRKPLKIFLKEMDDMESAITYMRNTLQDLNDYACSFCDMTDCKGNALSGYERTVEGTVLSKKNYENKRDPSKKAFDFTPGAGSRTEFD